MAGIACNGRSVGVNVRPAHHASAAATTAPAAIDSHGGVPKACTPTAKTGTSHTPIAHDTARRMVGYLIAT